jgi:hypothetical protein
MTTMSSIRVKFSRPSVVRLLFVIALHRPKGPYRR